MEAFEALKNAIEKVGAKHVAAELQVSTSLVYKWCQVKEDEGGSGADNPLERVAEICEITDDNGSVVWLCRKVNGYFVANPPVEDASQAPVLRQTQSILKEFSDLLDVVSRSVANDGKIDTAEAARIRREWEQLKSITEGFVGACEKGSYGPT
ncbi:MAG: hypothetical protein A3K18_22330 [Lentisphaerae bacterium RIFOXYA12_64_32]|nr:MAG: hypothetical protein A3K18_22330 [Lentisphaerae bacterium RIFOXYA12_64_32]